MINRRFRLFSMFPSLALRLNNTLKNNWLHSVTNKLLFNVVVTLKFRL